MATGQYLGPVIDVGNAMTYKILFLDGNYVCRMTVGPWTPVEEANHVFLADYEKYMSQVQEALGAACTVGHFEDADLTPEFDYYADDVEDGFEGSPDETLPSTLEVNDNYIGANVIYHVGTIFFKEESVSVPKITMVILLVGHVKTLSSIVGNMLLNL